MRDLDPAEPTVMAVRAPSTAIYLADKSAWAVPHPLLPPGRDR
jgi:hypothetical protein